jgi:hypothetical protein
VRSTALWLLPSAETTVSWIARDAGEDTVGGSRRSPPRIVNVAGRRAPEDPAGTDAVVGARETARCGATVGATVDEPVDEAVDERDAELDPPHAARSHPPSRRIVIPTRT